MKRGENMKMLLTCRSKNDLKELISDSANQCPCYKQEVGNGYVSRRCPLAKEIVSLIGEHKDAPFILWDIPVSFVCSSYRTKDRYGKCNCPLEKEAIDYVCENYL